MAAFDAAHRVVDDLADTSQDRGRAWVDLSAYLHLHKRDPLNASSPLLRSTRSSPESSPVEKVTIDILLNSFMAGHANPGDHQIPEEERANIGIGVQACKTCVDLARRAGDPALEAFYHASIGAGLARLGHLNESVTASLSGIVVYRRLEELRPGYVADFLAGDLHNLGKLYEDLGRFEDAIALEAESYAITRKLYEICPEKFESDFAMAKLVGTKRLKQKGKFEEALTAANDAKRMLKRALQRDNSPEIRSQFAHACRFTAIAVSESGQREQSLPLFTEVIQLEEEIANEQSNEASAALAVALNDRATTFKLLGRIEESLVDLTRSVHIWEILDAENPGYFRDRLSSTLLKLASGNDELGSVRTAAGYGERALEYLRDMQKAEPGAYTEEVAHAHLVLGFVLPRDERLAEGLEHTQKAAQIYEQLESRYPGQFQESLAMANNNLANRLGEMRDDEAARGPAQKAVETYRRQCEAGQQAAWPLLAGSLTNIAAVLLGVGEFDQAEEMCRESLSIYRKLDEPTRLGFIEENLRCCIRLAKLLRSERNKSRRPDLVEAYEILQEGSKLAGVFRGSFDKEENRDQAHQKWLELYELLVVTAVQLSESADTRDREQHYLRSAIEATEASRARQLDHRFNVIASSNVSGFHFDQVFEILQEHGDRTVVYFFLTYEDNGYAFILNAKEINLVRLPEFGRSEAWGLGRWQVEMRDSDSRQAFKSSLGPMLGDLARLIVWPVWRAIDAGVDRRRGAQILICPHLSLHSFPFHACCLPDGSVFGEATEIAYAPNLALASHSITKSKSADSGPLITAVSEYPYNAALGDLPLTLVECQLLQSVYGNAKVFEEGAFSDEIMHESVGQVGLWCHTGHADYNPGDPFQSGIELRDGVLTVANLLSGEPFASRPAMSLMGCEVNYVTPSPGDDPISIATGMMVAGARTVVGPLWSISDLASTLWSYRFHNKLIGGASFSRAASEASRWLRGDHSVNDSIRSGKDLKQRIIPLILSMLPDEVMAREFSVGRNANEDEVMTVENYLQHLGDEQAVEFENRPCFENPYYWAPFVVNGAGWDSPGQS